VESLKAVITHAEGMLRQAQDDGLEHSQELRAQIQERLHQARLDLARLHDSALGRMKDVCHGTDEYVQHHPWRAAGVAAATGLLVGMLLSRR
jgi:ElaB/YqjD/DUF883 family membrane-anchored ribosome-binding protein